MTRALAVLLSLLTAVAFAQDEPHTMVRTRLEPSGPVVVGQQVKLVVDVLVTTWFLQAPAFPPLPVTGAVVQLSDDQPPHLTEQIKGEKWYGISRAYVITPQTPGELAIPAFDIILHPGQAKGAVKIRTRSLKLTVKGGAGPAAQGDAAAPGQVGNLPATAHLQLTQSFDRKLTGLKVGDAFTRMITIVADGTQAMFLPPTVFPAIEGLTLYSKAPRVENVTRERIGFVAGRRIDSATYVVMKPGDFVLPEVKVDWWDTRAGKRRSVRIAEVKFSAAPNPGYKPEFALPNESAPAVDARTKIDWRRVGIWAVGLVVLTVTLWLLSPIVLREWRALQAMRADRKRRYESSEAAAFARLERAVRSRDESRIVAELYRWLDKMPRASGCVDRAAKAATDPAFSQVTKALLDRRYGVASPGADFSALVRSLPRARKRLTTETRPANVTEPNLTTLNPQ